MNYEFRIRDMAIHSPDVFLKVKGIGRVFRVDVDYSAMFIDRDASVYLAGSEVLGPVPLALLSNTAVECLDRYLHEMGY